jgi:hypothetical protein
MVNNMRALAILTAMNILVKELDKEFNSGSATSEESGVIEVPALVEEGEDG